MHVRFTEYVKETGLFKSLKEKEVTLPKISDLQQCAVVHTGIKAHTEKDSRFYNGQVDVIHSFDSVKEMIQKLHSLGSSKLYLHLDGWGDPGYDNCHPDYLPACIEAGGWAGLKNLQDSLSSQMIYLAYMISIVIITIRLKHIMKMKRFN